MSTMDKTIMDFITEFYNKHSIYIYIENLTKIERCLFYQMIKQEVNCFDLRFRESHYNKENYKVMLSHLLFYPEYLDKNELFIDLRIDIINESNVRERFSEYMKERNGEIFNNHTWDIINKNELKKYYFS